MTDHNPDPPDLEQPPSVIEGSTGGPAFPTGGLSTTDKQEIGDAGETIELTSYGVAVGAGLAGMGGVVPAAAGLGVFAGFLYAVSQILSSIAGDPPRPFARVVSFDRRVSNPPSMSDPVLERVGVASQYAITAVATGNGYLDALERLGGAQRADDYNWAVTHSGVAVQCHAALAIDLSALAAAMNSAGLVLAGTSYDAPLAPGAGGVRSWIETPGTERVMARHMKAGGARQPEIQSVLDVWKRDPVYRGSASSLSGELKDSAATLHAIADRLFND